MKFNLPIQEHCHLRVSSLLVILFVFSAGSACAAEAEKCENLEKEDDAVEALCAPEEPVPVAVTIINETNEEVYLVPHEDDALFFGDGDYFCDVPLVGVFDSVDVPIAWPRPARAICNCDQLSSLEGSCRCSNCQHQGKFVRLAPGAIYPAGEWSGTEFSSVELDDGDTCAECVEERAVAEGSYTLRTWASTICSYQAGDKSVCPLCTLNSDGWCEMDASSTLATPYDGVQGSATINYPVETSVEIRLYKQ